MTTENKETVFDVRQIEGYEGGYIETATEASAKESPTKHDLNCRYGVMGKAVRKPLASEGCVRFPNGVRSMIQFVPGNQDTTESRLKDIREEMTFTRAKKTIRRSGWYFTESYAPCGKYDLIPGLENLTTMFGNEKAWAKMGKEDIGV